MADEPLDILGNKTPLEAARTPYMDQLALKGEVGLLHTIPKGMKPGSDTANLSVMGYNPKRYYTGRSPLEAISIGASMESDDVCFRVNFVTLSEDEEYEEKRILDHSSDEITSEEAAVLLKVIAEAFQDEIKKFYTGVSYRHALIWHGGSTDIVMTPPHDILTKRIGQFMPKGQFADVFIKMMKESYHLLNHHPINEARREKGLRPANSIWPWGEGTKPDLESFETLFNKKGAMISAVDLLKGIAIAANMESIDVEGVTGNIHTNYEGKVEAAINTLKQGNDFVYIHIEAPDECGHQGDLASKVRAIELIDEKVVGPIYQYFIESKEAFKLAVLPDHPTPIRLRTHTSDPVPYLIFDSENQGIKQGIYSEEGGLKSGKVILNGHEFMPYFFGSDR